MRHDALPLGDARAFARARRRTLALRLTALAAAAGALAAAILVLPAGQSRAGGDDPAPETTMAVVDVSGSIEGTATQRVAALLDSISHSRGRRGVGLVVFSDTAYVALPPGTAQAALRPFSRFFERADSSRSGDRLLATPYRRTPWQLGFSRGTLISAGLDAARRALLKSHVRSADVVLASDLFDGDTPARLTRALAMLTRVPGVRLSVDPLPPYAMQELPVYRQFAGRRPLLYTPEVEGAQHSAATTVPVAFLLAIAAVLVALAGQELLGTFCWGERG